MKILKKILEHLFLFSMIFCATYAWFRLLIKCINDLGSLEKFPFDVAGFVTLNAALFYSCIQCFEKKGLK